MTEKGRKRRKRLHLAVLSFLVNSANPTPPHITYVTFASSHCPCISFEIEKHHHPIHSLSAVMPSRLQGGVYITTPNGLRGDIISNEEIQNEELKDRGVVVRLRGSMGQEIPVDDQELVEYTSEISSEQPAEKQEEDVRYHLYQKAAEKTSTCFYLEERILAVELGDEFTYLVVSNSVEEEPLPPDVEGKALVRMVEAFFIGQGSTVANGRHLTSFHKALRPFWEQQQDGVFSPFSGETSGELFDKLNLIFSGANMTSGLVFFRAFCYAQQRLDYHQNEDSLLDAYCVVFYAIQLLEGKIAGMDVESFSALIEQDFVRYKSSEIDMAVDDLLWCFCILCLRIGSDVRRYKGLQVFNSIFPKPFDLAMNEELYIAKLAMELRKESPVSFLSSYRMVMDTKEIVPVPFRIEWMKFACEYAVRGVVAADRLDDPFFQYTFQMIVAYWMPTTSYAPGPYSFGEIQSRIEIANDFKKDCKGIVPEYMFWIGKQHEVSIQKLLKSHPGDRDTTLRVALIDAFTYSPIDYLPSSKRKNNDDAPQPLPDKNSCARCSKQVQRRMQCSRCGKVQYCSKDCQVAHWKGCHSKECIPKKDNNPKCGNCSKVLQKSLKCTKCGQVGYCNRKCQIQHWKQGGHKQECRKLTAEQNGIIHA
jgi:hypothetical protein